MMEPNPYSKYKKAQVEMASPGKLALLCFNGIIKLLRQSLLIWEKGKNFEEINAKLLKAQTILEELMYGLNPGAGQVAYNLLQLYDYSHHRLVEANIQKDPDIIKEVLQIIVELKDTWEQALSAPWQNVL